MKIVEFFKTIGQWIKARFLRLLPRLKPRLSFSWILSAIIWLIIIGYVGFGIYAGVLIYKDKSESAAAKFAVKIYPYPAALVNGSVIWAKDYYQQLNYIRQFSLKTQQPVPDPTALRAQILDQLIENKILEMQAVKYNVKVTDQDVNDAYQKIVDQSGGATEVKKVLNDLYGMNETDFKTLVRQQVLKEKFQNDVMTQIKVAHILIKDEGTANTVATQAKVPGADFAALAKQYSEDTKSAPNGGELGWLGRGQLVVNNTAIPEFDAAAFAAKKGEVVGPVKTSIGFEIIKVEDTKGQVNQDYNAWLAGLKKQAKIWRFIN